MIFASLKRYIDCHFARYQFQGNLGRLYPTISNFKGMKYYILPLIQAGIFPGIQEPLGFQGQGFGFNPYFIIFSLVLLDMR